MKPELKAKWVAALRSGEYKQAVGVLRSDTGGYCCLGVLRELVHPGSKAAQEDAELLCSEHRIEFGLPGEAQRRLSAMNDGNQHTLPHTFAQLADYIDANL